MTPSRHRDVRHLTLRLRRSDRVAPHSHPTHQLLRIGRGALAMTHDGASWVIPTGGSVWVPAAHEHRLEALEETELTALYIRARPTDRFAGPGPVSVTPLLEALAITLSRRIPDAARRARLEAVVRDELADLRPLSFIVALPVDPAARRVAVAVIADPADGRTVVELAADTGVSVRTLQRRFREQTGLTFQTWRRRAGLQHGMLLLREGCNITEAAHRCGFTSSSAFIAAFRRELGQTPAQWRRLASTP